MRPFTGMKLHTVFATIDPACRFTMPDGTVRTAKCLTHGDPIPGDCGGAIYTAYEDEDGFVYIGIAPGDPDENISEWINDQMRCPLFKSLDKVDILGNVIGDLA